MLVVLQIFVIRQGQKTNNVLPLIKSRDSGFRPPGSGTFNVRSSC